MPEIELNPKFAIIYNDPRNTLDINVKYGSGNFHVKSNDSKTIINYDYSRLSNIITISPINIGFAQIIVEDSKLSKSEGAISNILVVEADYLILTTDSHLIQEGNSTLMKVCFNILIFSSF